MSVAHIPFSQWQYQGRTFVIIDETLEPLLFEQQKPAFAALLINSLINSVSINAAADTDELIFLQPCRPESLRAIHRVHHYWEGLPDAEQAEFLLRAFQACGAEQAVSKLGIGCARAYLQRQYGANAKTAELRILCDVPSPQPSIAIASPDDTASLNQIPRARLVQAGQVAITPLTSPASTGQHLLNHTVQSVIPVAA